MDDSEPFFASPRASSATRPLLGLTVLAVEDSRFACEALRLMCLRSGARLRRADCLKSARRHLRVYRPSAILVDMGLPDGSGADLIAELAQATPRIGVILGLSGDTDAEDEALEAGADGFLAKPLESLAGFQLAVLSHLPDERRPGIPQLVSDETVDPDPMAFHDDMSQIAEILTEPSDDKALDYAAQFLGGVARQAKDRTLAEAAHRLARARAMGAPLTTEAARLAGLVQSRLDQRKAI